MRWPFMLRRTDTRRIRRKDERIGILLDERDKARAERNTAVYNRQQLLSQLAEAEAANKRLAGRNKELSRRLDDAHDNQLSDASEAMRLDARVARLRRVGARLLAAYLAEKRRADLLQARLDDACGLNDPAVAEGLHWQERRHDGGRKAVAS